MRADMHKVICERPRRHYRDAWPRPRQSNVPLDALPRYQSMRGAHPRRKEFGENLAPLRRWLFAQVGRPWDAVYSEACQVIKPDSVVRNHIKFHLLEMVERHTFLKDGEVWFLRRWNSDEVPITYLSGDWTCYVSPVTGCLCRNPPGPRSRHGTWQQQQMEDLANRCRWVNDSTAYLKCKGSWFECEMRPITPENEFQEFDCAQHRRLSRHAAEQLYGKAKICATKRQLSHKELREHGLTNEAYTARGDQSLAA